MRASRYPRTRISASRTCRTAQERCAPRRSTPTVTASRANGRWRSPQRIANRLASLCRIHPVESVVERGRRAGQQYAHIAQTLELAVHGDARERGQVTAMLREQDARPRRYGGNEAGLPCE